MSYAEFPHVNYEDTDFQELIQYYETLVANYEGTLASINALTERLDKYERETTAYVNRTISEQVDTKVAAAIEKKYAEWKSSIEDLQLQINQLSNKVTSYIEEFEGKIDAVNYYIADVNSVLSLKIDNVESSLNNKIRLTNDAILEVDSESKERDFQLQQDIAKLEKSVAMQIAENRVWVDNQLRIYQGLNKAYVDVRVSALHRMIEDLKLESGVSGVEWLWKNACNFGGYDCMQWYMDSGITCEDWNKSQVTCLDWWVRGREVFKWFERQNYMFSPISGRWVNVKIALLELASKVKFDGLTAEEYDTLKLEAGKYDASKITAYQYDWLGGE